MFWYTILSAIDNIFFTLVRDCFKLVLYLADVEIFSESVIKDFSNRVYMLLAVIMFFKIAVSTIQYLVDPEKLSDSTSGAGAIIKNAAISIILLVVVPEVFKFARAAQSDLAGYIPAIIMGDDYKKSSTGSNVADVTDQANRMTSSVMKIFYTPKAGKTDFAYGKVIRLDKFREQVIHDGCEGFDIWHLDKYFSTDSCSWNYVIILPVVVAGLMIFVLVSMGIDIAIRAIKFALLEIMAPIPIVSYIDKGGKGAFEAWLKEVKDVYIDLFMRIAVIYFIIFIIDKLVLDFDAGNLLKHMNGEGTLMKGLVLVFIIIGLLLFGKTAPKYLCDALGIKGTDKLSPMFKRAGGLLGTAASGLTAGAANIANARARIAGMKESGEWANKSARDKLRERLKGAASGMAGSSSALFRGGRAALSGKSMKEAFNTGHKGAVTARQNRELDQLNDIHFRDRAAARYQDFMGIDTRESLAEAKQKAYATLHSDVGDYKKAIIGRISKNSTVALHNEFKAGSTIDQLGQALAADDAAIQKLADDHPLKVIRRKLEYRTITMPDGSTKSAWTLKGGETLGYHDLEGIRAAAEQEKLVTTSGAIASIKTVAEKELFNDAMAGNVRDRNGNLIDDMNYGSEGYTDAEKAKRKPAHSDITTAVQKAKQHIAENAVQLNGGNATELQEWFEGTSGAHAGENFASLDDKYQRESEKLSGAMSTSTGHLARESIKRRDANKSNKSS